MHHFTHHRERRRCAAPTSLAVVQQRSRDRRSRTNADRVARSILICPGAHVHVHKAEDVIEELKAAMMIMIPTKDLELREATCIGDTVSSRVLGGHEPIIKGLLKHVNSHINENAVRLSIHETNGTSFHKR